MPRPQNLSPQTSGLGAKPHQASSLSHLRVTGVLGLVREAGAGGV